MQKDLYINFGQLHNDQHFQYFVEFGHIVVEFTPEALRVKVEFEAFDSAMDEVDRALKKIPKSPLTEKIKIADSQRCDYFRGLVDTCRLTTRRHLNEKAKEAAIDLMIVFDTYGNIARKPMGEKTSAMINLLNDLNGKYAEAVTTAGLSDWVEEFGTLNSRCYKLIQERWDNSAQQRPTLSMKDARLALEAAYNALMEMALAQRTVTKEAIYDAFFRRVKVVIDSVNRALAQRGAKNDTENSIPETEA
jgi:hypothetical protein